MTAKNDITGDSIKSKTGDQKKYSEGYDRIFRKSQPQQQQTLPTPEEEQRRKEQAQDPKNG
jgi:hypothetical protein